METGFTATQTYNRENPFDSLSTSQYTGENCHSVFIEVKKGNDVIIHDDLIRVSFLSKTQYYLNESDLGIGLIKGINKSENVKYYDINGKNVDEDKVVFRKLTLQYKDSDGIVHTGCYKVGDKYETGLGRNIAEESIIKPTPKCNIRKNRYFAPKKQLVMEL
jgi:hypothetical protein